jgi:hypothetical protein
MRPQNSILRARQNHFLAHTKVNMGGSLRAAIDSHHRLAGNRPSARSGGRQGSEQGRRTFQRFWCRQGEPTTATTLAVRSSNPQPHGCKSEGEPSRAEFPHVIKGFGMQTVQSE